MGELGKGVIFHFHPHPALPSRRRVNQDSQSDRQNACPPIVWTLHAPLSLPFLIPLYPPLAKGEFDAFCLVSKILNPAKPPNCKVPKRQRTTNKHTRTRRCRPSHSGSRQPQPKTPADAPSPRCHRETARTRRCCSSARPRKAH